MRCILHALCTCRLWGEISDIRALYAQDKRVKDVMTPMNKVYMIEAGVRLNFEHMLEIYRSGYTRIPVYDKDPQNIIGILYTKDLILVDPGAVAGDQGWGNGSPGGMRSHQKNTLHLWLREWAQLSTLATFTK